MIYDYSKLRGKIVEVYGKVAPIAKAMKLSERTLSLKLNNKVYWKQPEIELACTLLGIPGSDIPTYFFAKQVH